MIDEPNDGYLNTVKRLEPEIHPIDTAAALASISISLKRIVDALNNPDAYGLTRVFGKRNHCWIKG